MTADKETRDKMMKGKTDAEARLNQLAEESKKGDDAIKEMHRRVSGIRSEMIRLTGKLQTYDELLKEEDTNGPQTA